MQLFPVIGQEEAAGGMSATCLRTAVGLGGGCDGRRAAQRGCGPRS